MTNMLFKVFGVVYIGDIIFKALNEGASINVDVIGGYFRLNIKGESVFDDTISAFITNDDAVSIYQMFSRDIVGFSNRALDKIQDILG